MCIRDRAIGTQSVVVVFDVQKRGLFNKYELVTHNAKKTTCLLYTSDAADERSSVDLGGRRIIKKKKK